MTNRQRQEQEQRKKQIPSLRYGMTKGEGCGMTREGWCVMGRGLELGAVLVQMFAARSSQVGLVVSIRAILRARFQSLSSFSRAIAFEMY